MILSRSFFAAVSVATLCSTAFARPQLDADRTARLEHWDVLSFGDAVGNGLVMGKAIGIFDATPEDVFRVATDYTKWPDYLPRVRATQVSERKRDGAIVEITLELPWPVGKMLVTARYKHEHPKYDIYRVKFNKLRGNMKQYLGSFFIEPWSPGRTALTYELVAQPDTLAPKSLINRAVQRSAAAFVNALRQRVDEMHRMGMLHPELPPQKSHSPLVGKPPAEREVQAEAR